MSARIEELRMRLPEDCRETANVVEKEMAPEEIIRDASLQARQALNPETITRYARKYESDGKDALPALWVWRNDDGEHVLLEGWHRREAAERAGCNVVNVVVFSRIPHVVAASLAAQANLGHGLRLKPREIREALKMGWQGRYKAMSSRQIAAELGTGRTNVQRWIKEDRLKRDDELQADSSGGTQDGLEDYWAFMPVTKDGRLNLERAGRYLANADDLKGIVRDADILGVPLARQLALKKRLTATQRIKLLAHLETLKDDLERVAGGDLSAPPSVGKLEETDG